MKRAAFACVLILASMIVSVSIIASPTPAYGEPSVGVKEGDWIEYNIGVTGTGIPPPTHDVRWMRITILPVQGTAFSANFTVRYANGTIGSAIWKFNFTGGNVEGWLIIPSNLGPGDTFYDSSAYTGKPVNVTVKGQEQKTVLGASRTVTYGNDSLRHKEWDKATGVFIGSSEHLENVTNKAGWYIENLTVTVKAVATSLWRPEIVMEPNQTVFYAQVAVFVALVVLALPLAIAVARRKTMERPVLRSPSQGQIAAVTIVLAALLEVGTMFFSPFYAAGLSFAQINLIMQTIWTAVVLVSLRFRSKGNYFMHELTMLVVISAWAVGLTAVLLMDPFSSSTGIFSNTPLRFVMNSLHGIFSVPALVLGLWLVVLWRPESPTFASKSRRLAQLIPVLWIVSYVVGVLDFMLLHTTFLG